MSKHTNKKAKQGTKPSNKRTLVQDETEDHDHDHDMWFDDIDEMVAQNPSQLHFRIFNYCIQNGGFFVLKKTSELGKAFDVFEKQTGQKQGAYRYRYAGTWLDRSLSANESGLGDANKITIEAWPRGFEVPKYCHHCDD